MEYVISPVGSTYPHAKLPDGAVAAIYWNLTADAKMRLQEMVEKQASDRLPPEFVVHKGFVPETILTFAEEQSGDLVVMGTHRRRGWDRLRTGSVTESTLRKSAMSRAGCPQADA